MFTSQGLGEMGYGLAGSIGAAVSSPNKNVLCLNCDGGIMMNLQELHTIVSNNLNIKIIIFSNDGYLMIKHTQKLFFKGRFTSVNNKTGIGLPNFEKLLPGFGYKYFRLNNLKRMNKVMKIFLGEPNHAVLEVFMDPVQDFIPKVRGVINDDNSIIAPPIEDMSPLLKMETMENDFLIETSEISKKIKR
jgi:acetolactate synthase-1/2/3 large subunit